MDKLILGTHNEHKTEEIRNILGHSVQIISLKDLKMTQDIPETGSTLQNNALQKAQFVYNLFRQNCLSDDTGLEVEALNGEPGVYSARYAGLDCNPEHNIDKLLENLKGKTNRKACFKTVIALFYNNKTYFFEGKVKGKIARERHGKNGFGYDPIFIPEGFDKSFAELTSEEKNRISHRARAIEQLKLFLEKTMQ